MIPICVVYFSLSNFTYILKILLDTFQSLLTPYTHHIFFSMSLCFNCLMIIYKYYVMVIDKFNIIVMEKGIAHTFNTELSCLHLTRHDIMFNISLKTRNDIHFTLFLVHLSLFTLHHIIFCSHTFYQP